jgi:hypothetical protein
MGMMTKLERREYQKKYMRGWRQRYPEKNKISRTRSRLKNLERCRQSERRSARKMFLKKLGITEEDYNRMFFQQQGRCWICDAEAATHKTSPEKRLVIDHDHFDGTVRGLLCHKCNKALGLFNDNPELLVKAIAYLTQNAKETAA